MIQRDLQGHQKLFKGQEVGILDPERSLGRCPYHPLHGHMHAIKQPFHSEETLWYTNGTH